MANAETDISIDRSADDVWKLVRDFGGIAEWMPGVETCEVEGDVRTIGMMGISVKEKLVNLDEEKRSLSYSIVESPMGNLESHLVTIRVAPAGDTCQVSWTTEVAPDELMGLFQPMYESAIGEIKKKAESSVQRTDARDDSRWCCFTVVAPAQEDEVGEVGWSPRVHQ